MAAAAPGEDCGGGEREEVPTKDERFDSPADEGSSVGRALVPAPKDSRLTFEGVDCCALERFLDLWGA